MGKRLKTAKTQLTSIPTRPISINTKRFILIATIIIKSQQIAINILAPGPAKATQIMPFFPERSALKLIGTGLAHPKINPDEESNKTKGIAMVPIGSMCLVGSKVTLPIILAV